MTPAKSTKDSEASKDGEASSIDFESMTYEELVGTLENLTSAMSSSEVGIEEATDLYERATQVHRLATLRLDAIRDRIEKLEQSDV